MKKFIALVTLVMIVAFAGVCMAGENGVALNRTERVVDKLVNSFDAGKNITYAELAKGFSSELQQKVQETGFAELQKQVAEKFGRLQDIKMVSFERFDQGDRTVYLAGFSKEKIVRMIFAFDKDGKMTDFILTPVDITAGK